MLKVPLKTEIQTRSMYKKLSAINTYCEKPTANSYLKKTPNSVFVLSGKCRCSGSFSKVITLALHLKNVKRKISVN